jgi:hypothetical protein
VRIFLVLLTAALLLHVGSLEAANPRVQRIDNEIGAADKPGYALPIAPWVRAADVEALKSAKTRSVAPSWSGARPAVLVETNYPAYDPAFNLGSGITVYLSTDAMDYPDPVTIYGYWQNRRTGRKLYFNAVNGLLTGGQITDIFGSEAGIPVWAPTVDRLPLFAPAGGAFGEAPVQATNNTGRFQFVIELRDYATGQPVARGNAMYSMVDDTNFVSTNVTSDTTWTADDLWYLETAIFVDNGATLTIEPGTTIMGDTEGKGTLIVAQDAMIMAEGTAMQPIIMTSPQELGSRAPQDWGGLILNGRATINVDGGISEGEGDTGEFGGGINPDDTDNSGNLAYVRVEFAGIEFSPDNELNGIAFQGTGDGGTYHHIQVHYNQDDGVEFFGGTSATKYVLLTGIGDDSMDWTMGWRGKAQFVVAVQEPSVRADQGFECDNLGSNNVATPIADPEIYNVTAIGGAGRGSRSDQGVLLREGTGGKLHNFIVWGFHEWGLNVDDEATFNQANGTSPNLTFANSIVHGNGTDYWFTDTCVPGSDPRSCWENVAVDPDSGANWQGTDEWFANDMSMNRDVFPELASPAYVLVPDVSPLTGSPALMTDYVQSPPDDGFFSPVDFIGGVSPGSNWTHDGWTIWSKN